MRDDHPLAGEWLPVCNSAAVPDGKARGFVVADERIVVWRDWCAQLSLGHVTGDQIVCPYHG